MVGRLISEEITLGQAQSVNIDTLRIDRLFEQKNVQKEYNIVQNSRNLVFRIAIYHTITSNEVQTLDW